MIRSAVPRLQSLEFRTLDLELRESFAISGGAAEVAELVLFRLRDCEGNVGLGEAAPFPAYDGMTRKKILEAVDRFDLSFLEAVPASEAIASNLSWIADQLKMSEVPGPLMAALEMAWLDLLGKSQNVPVFRLLGNPIQQPMTGITIVVGSVNHAEETAKRYREMGFSDLKIKLSGDGDLDLKRLLAVQMAYPDCRLLLDVNGGFELNQAVEFVEALSATNVRVAFLEQPLPASCYSENAQLSEKCPIPILADESCTSMRSFSLCMNQGKFAGVNLKTQKCGVWESIQIHEAAVTAGCALMIGGMVESPLSMTLSAHLVKGLGSFDWVDLDTPLFIKEHPFKGGIQFDSDHVHFHEGPGLGISLDPDFPGWGNSEWIPIWQRESR